MDGELIKNKNMNKLNLQKVALYLVNKPAGLTSFEVVKKLKKNLNCSKLGHAGTLDKFAAGVLPVFVNEGLKCVRFFQEPYPELISFWKEYEGVIQLGALTTTGDSEGEVIEKSNFSSITKEEIEEKMKTFIHEEYIQVPPLFSAKKIQGRRASDLARQNIEVKLKPSRVFIKNFECLNYNLETGEIFFRVLCSKGTYIRSLAVDLANKLNQKAYLSKLVRTKVGAYKLSECNTLEEIEKNKNLSFSLYDSINFMPKVSLEKKLCNQIQQGKISKFSIKENFNIFCLTDEDKKCVAIIEKKDAKTFNIVRVFLD